jgi:uncharacterized damage-inducible protein DinB
MYVTIKQFLDDWTFESASTQSLFDLLTDASLSQEVYPGGRSIGRLAWHIAQTVPEMMARTGLTVTGVGEHDPVPASAAAIANGYRAAAASLAEQISKNWTDATLTETDDMYGEKWSRGSTLSALVRHQTHHRGQLTVLMRQAGLPVRGVYGPAKEDWAKMGMEPPPI